MPNEAIKEACDRLFNTILAVCPAHKCETCGNDATKRCEGCGDRFCESHLHDASKSGEKTHCATCYECILDERYVEFIGGRADAR